MKQLIYLFVVVAVMIAIQITIKSHRLENPLTVVTNYWIGYEPLYVAREIGEYNPKHIKLIEQQNIGDVISAFKNRLVDAAAVPLDEALILSTIQDDFSIILIFDYSNGADAIVARDTITDISELKNKRIGFEQNGISSYLLHRVCELNNIDKKSVKRVQSSVDEHSNLLRNKNVDAVITYEPFVTQLQRLGYHKVFSTQEIPNEIIDVLIVRNNVLKEKTLYINELMNGYFYAIDLMKIRDKKAIDYILKRLNLHDDEIDAILKNVVLMSKEDNIKHFKMPNEDCKRRIKIICKTLNEEISIDKCEEKYKLFTNLLLQKSEND